MNGKELHESLSNLYKQLEADKVTPQKALALAKVANVMISNAMLHVTAARLTGVNPRTTLLKEYTAS